MYEKFKGVGRAPGYGAQVCSLQLRNQLRSTGAEAETAETKGLVWSVV